MKLTYQQIDAATMDVCAKKNGQCVCAMQRRHVNPMCKDCWELRERVRVTAEKGMPALLAPPGLLGKQGWP